MAKYLTNKCVICQKLRKKTLGQIMGQIPSLRVAAGLPPFSNTAINMFGPFHIRNRTKDTKGSTSHYINLHDCKSGASRAR